MVRYSLDFHKVPYSRSQCFGWGLGFDNNTSKAILNFRSISGIDTVILQAGKISFSDIYCDYIIRLYKIENRYFLQAWSWPCCYHISGIHHTRFWNILCDILENMVSWVAILPRVDQLTKMMPNFWRAVYLPPPRNKEVISCWTLVSWTHPLDVTLALSDKKRHYFHKIGTRVWKTASCFLIYIGTNSIRHRNNWWKFHSDAGMIFVPT